MVRGRTFPPGEERRGTRNALLHPFQRRRVLAAYEEVISRQLGVPLDRQARRQLYWGTKVLLWKDRAVVGSGVDLHRDRDGAWHVDSIASF